MSLSKEASYQSLDSLDPPPKGWSAGVAGRVKEVPFGLNFFKLGATNDDIEWFITNDLVTHLTREMVVDTIEVRWQIEEFHRSFKQLSGAEKCKCRPAQPQRNHSTYCYLAWASLRQYARHLGQTMYHAHQQ